MAMPKSASRFGDSAVAEEALDLDLDRVYRDHAARVASWIARLSGPEHRSEVPDLLHEVFLVVERKLPEFRGQAELTTWLYAIALRVVGAERRKARFRRFLFRRAEPEIQLERPAPETPLGALERERATVVVYRVLDRLSERDRTLLILFELEGLPCERIAAILGLSQNNVWVSLSRARERFKKAFVASQPDLEDGEEP